MFANHPIPIKTLAIFAFFAILAILAITWIAIKANQVYTDFKVVVIP